MDFDKMKIIEKLNESKIKKKYKKKINLFYKKSDLLKNYFIKSENTTKTTNTINTFVLGAKLYDKKFKKQIGNSLSNITSWKISSNEFIQEYTTIFLTDGTITFFSSSNNQIDNEKFNNGNKYIWKICSGTNKYLDIVGYIKISIKNDICQIKILYEYGEL